MILMLTAVERLRIAVRTLPGVLARFSEAEGEQRPSPERWTSKEVVGHLIDSASNNHQRFVRGQIASGQDFPGYEPEQWVRLQDYQGARWADLLPGVDRHQGSRAAGRLACGGGSLPEGGRGKGSPAGGAVVGVLLAANVKVEVFR